MQRRTFPATLPWIGLPIVAISLAFAAETVWEKTLLSWSRGPQMIGFTLSHAYIGILLIFLLAVFLGLLWSAASIVLMISTRQMGGRLTPSLLAAYGLAWILLSLPYSFWQRTFAERYANAPKAVDFVAYAAVDGDLKTVAALLNAGAPVNGRATDAGRTPLHYAAFGGKSDVISLLLSRGADVNALSAYGDTPMGEAISQNQSEAARLLAAQGGKDVRGTPEQRDKVIKDFVAKQVDDMFGHSR